MSAGRALAFSRGNAVVDEGDDAVRKGPPIVRGGRGKSLRHEIETIYKHLLT
jgi:hypothetical protein